MVAIYSVADQVVTLQHHYKNRNTAAFFSLVNQVLVQLKENEQFSQYISCATDKATLYFNLQNYTLAIQTLSELSPLIMINGSVAQKIRYYNLLAAIHGASQNFDEAFDYLQMACHLAEKAQDKQMLIRIYHNLSMYYFDNALYEQSMLYCQKSFAYYADVNEPMPNYYLLALTYARLLVRHNRLEEAEQVLKREAKNRQNYEMPHFAVQLKLVEMECLVQQHKIDEAYALLQQEIKQQTDLNQVVELYSELCKLSKRCKNDKQYLQDLKQFYEMKKSVIQAQKEAQLQAIQYYFDERPYKEISWKDPLTDVYNRRYLEENYSAYTAPHTVILFDIDHFKAINDQYGHLAGDYAIQLIASTASQFFSKQDALFVRLGGDEFAASFHVASAAKLQLLLEQFLNEVRALCVSFEQHTFSVTTSVGACYSEQPQALAHLMDCADKALYEAKRHGRNQLFIHVHEGDFHDSIQRGN